MRKRNGVKILAGAII